MISDIQKIIENTARSYGILTEDILGRSRSRSIVLARKVAVRTARAESGCSFPELGRIFRRDPSTIQYYCKVELSGGRA